ncbi:hypothetical protein NQ314_001008 [Rhamnusium bicolor]|uniref:Reverse transcriptase n=1 Tax=Rhamnusium bicolor TaxID=1586634 RepID=A0AAV8ZWG8_9CUCU|nr:hypothetical protein NQ314_001008 [Rhamnusium bicolor]
MQNNELTLAPEKTEAIALTGRKSVHAMTVNVIGKDVIACDNIKYLGVQIERNLSWKCHIAAAATKAERTTMTLCKIMPKTGGPKTSTRRLLNSVVTSTLLYAAPAWVDGLRNAINRNRLLKTQRQMLLRVCCAYRTVGTNALQVIASVPPIDLLAKERAYNYGSDNTSRIYNRRCLMDSWQVRWNNATDGYWTRQQIPVVAIWCKGSHGELNYHLTQFLSEHGSFSHYHKRIGKKETDTCRYCPMPDTAEHTVCQFPRWAEERTTAASEVGEDIYVGNIIAIMLEENTK